MDRRKLLKSIAAGSLISGGLIAAGVNAESSPQEVPVERADPRQVAVESLDILCVLRDGEVQRGVENPTDDAFRRLQESLGPGERISSNEVGTDCMTYCEEDCDVFCPDSKCYPTHSCETDKYCCRETTSDTTETDSTST